MIWGLALARLATSGIGDTNLLDKAGIRWNGWKDADLYVYEALSSAKSNVGSWGNDATVQPSESRH